MDLGVPLFALQSTATATSMSLPLSHLRSPVLGTFFPPAFCSEPALQIIQLREAFPSTGRASVQPASIDGSEAAGLFTAGTRVDLVQWSRMFVGPGARWLGCSLSPHSPGCHDMEGSDSTRPGLHRRSMVIRGRRRRSRRVRHCGTAAMQSLSQGAFTAMQS